MLSQSVADSSTSRQEMRQCGQWDFTLPEVVTGVKGISARAIPLDECYFADRYRFFHYPQTEAELAGFEAAQGAALLAYGLGRPGLAEEVAQ
ncbi:hypothetical protein KSZ_08940 [Dictyobacter formicarum]|uniref:Uncharacterized protein n=1 Tax=Dictyobacter formicarum TaxID=2778368 RepID=A0ABQ3VAQ1_9CHLR|nr:hypothetical protein KSZ_08940 [Dictyobacter formicarum]